MHTPSDGLLDGLFAPSGAQADTQPLPSKVFLFDQLSLHHGDGFDFRPIVDGRTVDGCRFAVHESALQPGQMPHPAHHHNGEEIFLMLEGTLEVTINGTPRLVSRGGVAFIGSRDEHGIRNPGPSVAKYYVIELGPQK